MSERPEVPTHDPHFGRRSLAGRTAIVTGSRRNIGKAIAVEFARLGANVVVNAHRNQEGLDAVAQEIRAAGGKAIAALADVSDPDAVARMVGQANEAFGSVDIVVSNVSIRVQHPLLQMTVAEWKRTFDTNLHPAFYLAKETMPGMIERRWGRFIYISGLDGFTGHIHNRADNIVCKIGQLGLAKAIGHEFGAQGITANVVAPGAIDTERDWSQYKHYRPAEVVKEIPVARIGTGADVAAACAYLVSHEAGFITGQTIHVNGGQFMF
jgi:NAD(P)-dependent dehydrogenase (short-subunit alcohol dehydrogenase family)